MIKKGGLTVFAIVLMSTVALLALTPRASSPQSARKPVIIANLACFQGVGAEVNPWMLRAAELACDEFGWKVGGIPALQGGELYSPTISRS